MQPAFVPFRFGPYQLTAHLGRGGMADVYRAVHTGAAGFERVVVVKKILSLYNDDPSFVQMFINEAKIAARLSHPNIVQVYELGEVDGEYFMAMEYVKGLDLVHALRWLARSAGQGGETRAFPPAVAAYVAREVCRGLACAHEYTDESGAPQPIIHRDVSPQNIMLTYDGHVKLLDFGIAKAMFSAGEATRTGGLKGKIAYMAPEQADGGSPGPESDLFAAGVVLYEMLVGKRLFKGENDFETLQRVKTLTVPPPSRILPQVPPELDAIALKSLERERAARYRRGAQMARDLDNFLQAARFTVDDMGEYIARTFPPEAREEVPDGGRAATPDPSGGSRPPISLSKFAAKANPNTTAQPTAAARPNGPRLVPSPPRDAQPDDRRHAPPAGNRRVETLVAALVGLAVFAAGAWFLFFRHPSPSAGPVIDPGVARVELPDLSTAAVAPPTAPAPAHKHAKRTVSPKLKIETYDDDDDQSIAPPTPPADKPKSKSKSKVDTFDD